MANTGAASARVFLDANLNGVMDAGEEPIEGAAFTVKGSRHPAARTDADGCAWLGHLPVKQNVDIALETATLEDPQWLPRPKGARLVPRPGRVAELDFPVIMTSEIDGTVYLVKKDVKRGIGNVLLELVDSEHNVVGSAKSAWDGFYIVPAVLPGDYLLRISARQLEQLNLADPGMREVTVSPDGAFVNGVDFFLTAGERPSEKGEKPPENVSSVEKPAPAKRLPFSVQVAACLEQKNAQNLVKNLKKKGYEAYIFKTRKPREMTWYKVRIGDYASKEEASMAASTFRKKEEMDAFVCTNDPL